MPPENDPTKIRPIICRWRSIGLGTSRLWGDSRSCRMGRPQLSSVARSCSARANHFQGFRGVPIFGVKRERFAQFLGAPFDLTFPAESQA